VPPWVGYNEEETMKTQILALSKVSVIVDFYTVWPTYYTLCVDIFFTLLCRLQAKLLHEFTV